ncbi:hypothetical protein IEQ34_004556 [Dendrobium chrysotoxum]|uniref:Uncharacterized protein n=1 Tax=Dendrobium chrysotoxum TaxID=161865 RepID=A0AAV7HII9_DENCH|nr:hypothetical protein IEQ34_004556 [Dendrobium chrysotoxum]
MPKDGDGLREFVHPLITDTVSLDSDSEIQPLKIHIPEDILKHAIEKFKKSTTYRQEIESWVQEAAYDKLFDVEVRNLDRQYFEEGFTHDFLKGVQLVQRKTRVSEDFPPYLGDVDLECELKRIFLSDNEDVEIIYTKKMVGAKVKEGVRTNWSEVDGDRQSGVYDILVIIVIS